MKKHRSWLGWGCLAALATTGILGAASGCADSEASTVFEEDAAIVPPTPQPDASTTTDVVDAAKTDATDCDASDEHCNQAVVTCADTDWCPKDSGVEALYSLTAIWGSSASDIWAVGSAGTVLHYDGNAWTLDTPFTPSTLRAIAGTSATNLWAVTTIDGIFHRTLDDAGVPTWQKAPPAITGTLAITSPLRGAWASGNDVVVVGDLVTVRPSGFGKPSSYYQEWQTTSAGSAWVSLPGADTLSMYGIWGPDLSQLWVVGNSTSRGGVAYRRNLVDGGVYAGDAGDAGLPGWTETDLQTAQPLAAVWGSGSADVWAVGRFGTIRHFDGTGWQIVESPTTDDLNAVWGTGPRDVWVAGDYGTILHFDGTSWQPTSTAWPLGQKPHLYGIWGSGANDVWAVGQGGTLVHFAGKFADAGGAQ
ncbi:hypothetical protein [Labilithrix luteola]|nr:hypothetical protein [Labilithrix luteola]